MENGRYSSFIQTALTGLAVTAFVLLVASAVFAIIQGIDSNWTFYTLLIVLSLTLGVIGLLLKCAERKNQRPQIENVQTHQPQYHHDGTRVSHTLRIQSVVLGGENQSLSGDKQVKLKSNSFSDSDLSLKTTGSHSEGYTVNEL